MAVDIRDLVQRAAAGEKQAWDTLVSQLQRVVWGILGKFANLTYAEKEDLFQDVFMILLERGLRHFRGSTEHELRAYVSMITANEAKSYLRKHSRRFEMPDSFLASPEGKEETLTLGMRSADPSPGPEELVAGQEQLEGLCRCLQELPLIDQQIFWLRERDKPYKEIAELLHLPDGTVASKYDRAKKKIEECLKKAGIL